MRRAVLLATSLMLPTILGGCSGSGFYSYLGDTTTFPGQNPNIATGTSETYGKVRKGAEAALQPTPMLFEGGDVWPGPPTAPPTLKDLQRQQNQEIGANGGNPTYRPLAPLPPLAGYDVPQQDVRRPSPPQSFPNGLVNLPNGGSVNGTNRAVQPNGVKGDGSIIVPNGNGTSTVIAPNGAVSTIPTPGK